MVVKLKRHVEELTGMNVNSALLNRYNNGHDHMSRHADDEAELGTHPNILSVTLGTQVYSQLLFFLINLYRSRLFEVVSKSGLEKHVLSLEPGSLIVMRGKTQQYHKISTALTFFYFPYKLSPRDIKAAFHNAN